MEQFIRTLRSQVEERLQSIGNKQMGIKDRAWESICFLEEAVAQLKKFVIGYTFRSQAEEITFFKVVKPRLASYLIYYRKIYNTVMHLPVGSREVQKEYLLKKLESIKIYFERNMDFYVYHRGGQTHMDHHYFLRRPPELLHNPESFYFERDPLFSTACDFRLAKILANEMLEAYLEQELRRLEDSDALLFTDLKVKHTWTGRKNDLIELLYALDSEGCFDIGTLSLSRLTTYIERTFNIDLSNITRTFTEMKIRNNPTPFLDRLKTRVLERMDRP